MVRDCTSEIVLHTMMLRGVSLFLFGILTATLFDLLSVSELGSNTGKASSLKVGSPVGNVLALFSNKDLTKGIAFPAVKISGLLFLINHLIFLVLLMLIRLTAGATRQLTLRGLRSKAFLHDTIKFLSLSLSLSSPSAPSAPQVCACAPEPPPSWSRRSRA